MFPGLLVDLETVKISAIILTFNSEGTLAATLEAASRVSDDIWVVDSFSTDRTREIARERGANVCEHEFVNYSMQRNWAIRNLKLRHDWELHLDADERLSDELISELRGLDKRPDFAQIDGFFVPRLTRFLGREIRHGGYYPIWHLRLFKRGRGRCEDREYDQHFLVDGIKEKLRSPIVDDIQMSIREWMTRHNRWSDAEADELEKRTTSRDIVVPRLRGDPIGRKRYLKNLYLKCPLLLRAFALFGYRYIIRLGFLDGRQGAYFFALESFCYRMVVDAKLYERSLERGRPQGLNSEAAKSGA